MKDHRIPIGKPLAGIEMNVSSIRFSFMNPIVELCAPFKFHSSVTDQTTSEKFDPWERTGDLNLLWRLLDVHASHIQMDDESFRLKFDCGIVLECINQGGAPELVLIWGGESPEGGIILTRYPEDL